MLASADAPLLRSQQVGRKASPLSGSVNESSKQVKIAHIMRLAISCGVLTWGANFREASHNDAKMASPETTETADATMYEKARTSVLLPKRNV